MDSENIINRLEDIKIEVDESIITKEEFQKLEENFNKFINEKEKAFINISRLNTIA